MIFSLGLHTSCYHVVVCSIVVKTNHKLIRIWKGMVLFFNHFIFIYWLSCITGPAQTKYTFFLTFWNCKFRLINFYSSKYLIFSLLYYGWLLLIYNYKRECFCEDQILCGTTTLTPFYKLAIFNVSSIVNFLSIVKYKEKVP